MNKAELTETHWHKSDLERWKAIQEAIPLVQETELNLWAHRCATPIKTPYVEHKYLYPFCCCSMSRAETNLHFLVVADTHKKASEIVQAQLRAHGFNPNEWSLHCGPSPMILAQ